MKRFDLQAGSDPHTADPPEHTDELDRLRRRIQELEESERKLKAEIAGSPTSVSAPGAGDTLLNTMIEKNADGMVMLDGQGRVVFANPAAEALFGIPGSELVGEPFGFPVLSGETAEIEVLTADERVRQVEMRLVAAEWRGDIFCVASLRDISERIRMARELKEKEQYFRSLINHLHEDLIVIDRGRRIVDINNTYLITTGHRRDQVIGRLCHAVLRDSGEPCRSEKMPCGLEQVFQTGKPVKHIHQHRCLDGAMRWIDIIFSPLFDSEGRVTHIIETARDITELKDAQEKVEQHSHFLQNLIDTIPIPIFYKDRDLRYLGCNTAFESALGTTREKIVGRTVHDLIPDEKAELFAAMDAALMENGGVQTYDTQVQYADGTRRDVIFNKAIFSDGQGRTAGLVGIITDITERKRMEQERQEMEAHLQRAQKLEAIGTLAGGIAHDFNNILAAIFGFAEMVREELPQGSDLREDIQEILNAGNRAKELVQQILSFSRQSEEDFRPLNIIPLIKESLKFLRAGVSSTIAISWQLPDEQVMVRSTPAQIHQIVMNLCTNAAYALSKNGGDLRVHLSCRDMEGEAGFTTERLTPGRYAVLRISDTGEGIEPAIINRIFDPYFTTKPKGEGTGLGLSVVHGVVKSHNGAVSVESRIGKGSVFTIYLPLANGVEEPNGAARQSPDLQGGEGRILCVDDEATLVKLEHRMLESLGYQAVYAISSRMGLELFRASPDAFDLVITDLRMPGMDGVRMGREIKKIRPDIPILLVTGHLDREVAENAVEAGFAETINKPVSKKELASKIRAILAGRNGCAKP